MSWKINRKCEYTCKDTYAVSRDRRPETHCSWKEHNLKGNIHNETFSCFKSTCHFTTKAYIYPSHGELNSLLNQ